MKRYWQKLFVNRVVKNEDGAILIFSLLITSMFVTFSAGYMGIVMTEAKNTEKTHRSNVALYVAESGVEEAMWQIKYNNSSFAGDDGWSGANPYTKTASLTTAGGETLGTYTVTVTDPTTTPIISSVASATYQGGNVESRTVHVELDAPVTSTYTMAVFANSQITMASNSCTDSWDSNDGEYDDTGGDANNTSDGDVGVNSTGNSDISMASNSEIAGDVFVGVGGNTATVIYEDSNATITGSKEAMAGSVTIPSISAPTGLTNRGSKNYNSNGSTTISDDGEYGDFIIDSNHDVYIDGHLTWYITNDFLMDSNSEIHIPTGNSLTLYVDGSVEFRSNADIHNDSFDPNNFIVYGTDSLVDDGSDPGILMNSNSEFYGIIHTKNATVELDSNAEVFGAVVAENVNLKSNTCVHYDTNLGSGGSSDPSTMTLEFWQEK